MKETLEIITMCVIILAMAGIILKALPYSIVDFLGAPFRSRRAIRSLSQRLEEVESESYNQKVKIETIKRKLKKLKPKRNK